MIKDLIGEAALLEQLAEEAVELAKAALKKARILRGENPTPLDPQQADFDLIEEFTDVCQCALELQLQIDENQMDFKNKRWINRLKEANLQKFRLENYINKTY